MKKKDPYKTLGVGEQATTDEIKKAFRKKAKEFHPDKNGNADQFSEVAFAYRLLMDPEKRNRYDSTGDASERDMQTDVFNAIGTALLQIIEQTKPNVEYTNILQLLRLHFDKSRQGCMNALQACERDIKNLKNIMKKFKRKNADTPDVITNILTMKIQDHERQMSDAKAAKTICVAVLKYLEDFDYEFDPTRKPPQQANPWNISSFQNVFGRF